MEFEKGEGWTRPVQERQEGIVESANGESTSAGDQDGILTFLIHMATRYGNISKNTGLKEHMIHTFTTKLLLIKFGKSEKERGLSQ